MKNKTILQIDVNEETKKVEISIDATPYELTEHLIGSMEEDATFAAVICAASLIFEKNDPKVAEVLAAGKKLIK